MYQVECGANGDAEDLVECRRLMNDAAKKVRQIAAAKAIAKKEGGEQPPDRVVNPELQLDWPPNEELEPLFNHIANIDEGLEQVLFCLACDPPKTEEAEEEAFLAAEEFLSKDPKWPVAPSWMIEEEEEPTADDDEEAPPDPLDALPPGPRPQPPIRVEVKRGLPPERHYGQGEGFTLRDVLDCKKMSKALARLEQRQLQVREGEWEEVVEGGRRRVGWGEWIWPDLKPLHDMAEEQKPRFHRQMYRWQAINYASDAIAAVKAAEQTTKESNKVSKAADYAREAGRFAELRCRPASCSAGLPIDCFLAHLPVLSSPRSQLLCPGLHQGALLRDERGGVACRAPGQLRRRGRAGQEARPSPALHRRRTVRAETNLSSVWQRQAACHVQAVLWARWPGPLHLPGLG